MIDYAIISETGEKERNEDAVRVFTNQQYGAYAFLVADGLGGHGNGDVASNFVADCIGAIVENYDDFGPVFIDECFDTAQEMLMEEKEAKGLSSIKTTLSFLVITDEVARWGHIGDTRIYHFHDGKFVERSFDHSVPQMLALSGEIKEKDIRHHESRNMLLKAMGTEWDSPAYEIDKRWYKMKPGDAFLICSDGFWEWIEEKSMMKVIRKDLSAFDALNEMAQEVKTNGEGKGMDNYSAILILIK